MERINTLASSFFTMLLASSLLFSGCSKSTAEPPTDEQLGPKETVVLPMLDVNNNEVGSLHIDRMNSGRAQARITINQGYYTAGENMKTNATLTTSDGTTVYATCTELDGKNGKCSKFPIKRLSSKPGGLFNEVNNEQGLVLEGLE